MALFFTLVVIFACLVRPGRGGKRVATSRRDRIAALSDHSPSLVLFAVVIGSVYACLATPTEAASIDALGWSPMQTVMAIIVFYLFLGMFIESLSIMLTTILVVFPIAAHMGIDPVWFGIVIIVLMETALIAPPIGRSLYVVDDTRTRGGKFSDVRYGALPFLIAMLVLIGFRMAFRDLATRLPSQVY